MKSALILAAAAALFALPLQAQAPRSESWQIGNAGFHIYFEDLDTTSASGRVKLLTRVEAAAAKLCPHTVRIVRRACVKEIVARVPNTELRLATIERQATRTAWLEARGK
jgi:UrcA family protein